MHIILTCWNEGPREPNRLGAAASRTAAEGTHVALENRNPGREAAEANIDGGRDDNRSRRGCTKEAPTAGERSELPGRLSRPSRPRKRDGHSLVQSRLFNNEATAKSPHRDIFAMVGNAATRCGRERNGERMDYTLDDLKAELAATEPGEETCVAYGQYALLFPPGEPDQGTRLAAAAFAKANGCTISNRPDDNLVCFVKPA